MGSARGNWDPREGQQPFRPNPNGAGDRTTTLRRLLIGAVFNFANSFSASFLIKLATTFFVRFLHIFLYVTFFCCVASSTSSFHHHVSAWFLLPFFFPHTSSQACSILFLKVFHRLGKSTNSLTVFLKSCFYVV